MRVFLSWSGDLSLAVAGILADWLPYVVSEAKPWMSEHDIQAGSLWEQELSDHISTTDSGILLMTKENQNAPWLLFEAGVLSKSSNSKKVIPYRIDLQLAEVAAPLTRFQGVDANLKGTLQLVKSLNAALPEPVPNERLSKLFDVFWPQLESDLFKILAKSTTNKPTRLPTEEYLEEILSILRGSNIARPQKKDQQGSVEIAINALELEIESIQKKISSMEDYENKGGDASSESWWDSYVKRHREAKSMYVQAHDLLERAKQISLNN